MKSRYRRRKTAATIHHMRTCPECYLQVVLWHRHVRLSRLRQDYGRKRGRRW